MTKFSIALGVGPREPMQRVGEIAQIMERERFHALWVQDNPLSTKDAYVALTVAALSTQRLVLAPGVSNTVTRHPSVIVNSICSLDSLAEGRVILGIGSGGPSLVAPLGIKAGRSGEFREALVQIKTLLQGKQATGPNEARYSVNSALRPLPVYVAASGPQMLKLTGELADGVVITGACQKDAFGDKVQIMKEAARVAGRNPKEVKANLMVTVVVNSDRQAALNDAKPFAASLLAARDRDIPAEYKDLARRVQEQHDYRTYLSAKGAEAQIVTDDFADYAAIAGDEAYCIKRLRSIMELDVDEITFRLLGGGRMQRLESLAKLIAKI